MIKDFKNVLLFFIYNVINDDFNYFIIKLNRKTYKFSIYIVINVSLNMFKVLKRINIIISIIKEYKISTR